MINITNISSEPPFTHFKEKYFEALNENEKNLEAISISSFSKSLNEVTSRFVNLKMVDGKKFFFFTNYNSRKAKDFEKHNQVSALIFWRSINTQIRIKANIKKCDNAFNKEYFESRSKDKNALAISSFQSERIESFESVKEKYNYVYHNNDLTSCPDYWGGFYFIPYYFEFWKGNISRLNKREVYDYKNNSWDSYILQP